MLTLEISPEVAKKITDFKGPNERILLDHEDGQGPFVDHAISCQLNPNFSLLFVDQTYTDAELSDYKLKIETNIGPIFLKESATRLLDQDNRLVIEPTYKRVQLKSDGGILVQDIAFVKKSKDTIRG